MAVRVSLLSSKFRAQDVAKCGCSIISPRPRHHRWSVETQELVMEQINTSWSSENTYIIVTRLLIFVALLVGFGFGLIWFALLHVKCLPPFSENLADLACSATPSISSSHYTHEGRGPMPTKGDAWIFLSYIVALFVGKEHVGGETTLRGVGIYRCSQLGRCLRGRSWRRHTFLLLFARLLGLGLAGGSLLLRHRERAARPVSFIDASGACYDG